MKNCIIIGPGPSGLTAGLELLRKGYHVTILEATDSVGGISKTMRHNNQRIDIGGHRFFSKDEHVMQWWKEILPVQGAPAKDDKILNRKSSLDTVGPDPELTDEVFLMRHRISRIYYKNKFFDYPISFKPQTFINMGLGTSFLAGCSYLASCIHKLPEDNLENFYINRFGRQLYSMFFEGYTTKVWGRSPKEISADWGAQRVKGVSVATLIKNLLQKILPESKRETETSLIEEFYYPKYGPGQMWETVAKKIQEQGGNIIFEKKVTSLEHNGTCITSVCCSDGSKYNADYIISSMPLQQLIPALGDAPSKIQEIAKGLPYRDFITIGLLVDKLALKNQTNIPTLGNIIPDCWIYVQDTSVTMGRIQIFNNWSPYMLENPENTVWIGLEYFCRENDNFWNMGEAESISFALNELKKIGFLDNNVQILDSCRERVAKAYPAYFDTYKNINDLIEYINIFDNLYCVGRNGQHRYNNMDHSMATAFAAINVIEGKADKHMLWNVNTERNYHEEKKL